MSEHNIHETGNSANNQQQLQHTGTGRRDQLNQLNERLATAYDYIHANSRAQESFAIPPPPSHQSNRGPFDAINNALNRHRREMNGRHMAPNNDQHGFQATPASVSHPQSQMSVFDTQYPYGEAPISLTESSQLPIHDMINGEYTVNPQMLAQTPIEELLISNDQQLSQPFHHEHTINPQMLVNDQVDGAPVSFAQSSQLPVHQINNSEYTVNPQMLAHNQVVGTPIDHGQQSQSIDYADGVGYLNNPHMFAHLQAEGTPINYSQQSQLTINGNQHQALDFSHDFGGHQQFQMSTDYTDSVGYLNDPQMFAQNQIERTPINHGQQSQLPIYGNQHQAHDFSHNFGQQQTQIQDQHANDIGHSLGQQASVDYPFQNGSINFDQPLSVPIHATNNNGHDISQRVPAHFQVAGTLAHSGQQPPQMPVNQTNFNGVNNNRQSIQAITTTRISSFANLSAEDQNAEFRHFFQQRLTQGDTTRMEFATFKSWYIGEQLDGKSKPTLAYGVAPLHKALRFASNVPKHQPMIPPDDQEHIQPSTIIYQGTGRELTTGFQYTMGPLPTLNKKSMRPNSEQYLQKPRKSTKSNVPARRASKAVASAGQSPLPVSLPSMVQPVLSSTARAPAPAPTPSAVATPALPSTARAPAPAPISSAVAIPALPSTARAPAPDPTLSAVAIPTLPSTVRTPAPVSNPSAITIPALPSTTKAPTPTPTLSTITIPTLPSTTKTPTPDPTPSAIEILAFPSTVKAPASAPTLSTITIPALPSTTRAQAPTQLATANRRDQRLQSGNPQQTGIITSAKGKEVSREQRNEATSAAQPTIIRADQIRSLAGKYTISLSNLPEIIHYDEAFEDDIFHALDAAISAIDTKIAEGAGKAEMPRNNESRTMVEMALPAILQKSIARLSLENPSDARKSFENYAGNIGNSSGNSLPFAPESQFVKEETKVVDGTKQTVRLVNDGVPACATHTFRLDKIECGLDGIEVKGSYSMYTKTTFTNATTPLKYAIGLEIQVAEIGNNRVRGGLLNYERPLPSNPAGVPRWADILDLFKLQAAEWGLNTRIQGLPTSQTSTSTSLSNKQQNDTKRSEAKESDIEQQMPFSRLVQGQGAKAGQPQQQKGRGDKRKRQHQPELHASPIISTSSSGDSSPSSNSSSQISNATTGTMSVSPRKVAEFSRLADNPPPPKRPKNGYRVGSLKRGTSMMDASSLMGQPPMNRISQNDHMHPARSLSESVRSPIATANATAAENLMPTQVTPLDSGMDAFQLHKLAMLQYVNNPRPYEYPTSESPQPSRTLSTRSDIPTQIQARLLRPPTEAELAPHREQVLSVWKSSFPKEKKSS
ncbi:hypothetical protein BCIN_07g03330 [Botrytis cinerea B05.10]|uniref:Uncharacterized protein n=1 Tax=Botryotinia fuckeliana (strain B05.10) TaxID=332648 RepID=A0A384JMD2_BOTFB|nr:hypothetical protein BCIN_07g03330 [Botrytis cinerea B05.10]ATZ51749.1 hypothetical protein BCIN_07g03330 [Botrytis cinerea B05.10]